MSDRIVPLATVDDYPPSRVNRSETAPPAEEPRVPAKPVRDWRALPLDRERVRWCANYLRAEKGKAAESTVRKWMRSNDSHFGIGVPYAELLQEIVQLDGAGVKPTPRPKPTQWTNNEMFGSEKNRGKL